MKCKYFSASLGKQVLPSPEQRRTCFSSYGLNELKVYGERSTREELPPRLGDYVVVVGKESVGPEAAGSRALFQVITPRSSKAPDRRSVVYPGKQGPGTGFQSFAKYSSTLDVSGKLPEAASPDRIVQTQKMGRPAVTGMGEMTHSQGL